MRCVNTLPGIEPVMPLYMYSLTWPDRRHVRAIYCMKNATGSEEKSPLLQIVLKMTYLCLMWWGLYMLKQMYSYTLNYMSDYCACAKCGTHKYLPILCDRICLMLQFR